MKAIGRFILGMCGAFVLTSVVFASLPVIWSKIDTDPYTHVAFSHNGQILALGRGSGNTSDLLNAADGSLIRTFSGRFNETNDLLFSADDLYVVNGTGGGGSIRTIDLWSVSDGTRLVGPVSDHTNGTYSVSITRDGQYVASSGIFDREINIWHIPDLSLVRSIPNDDPVSPSLPPRVKDSAFSPDGTMIASSDIYSIKVRRPDGSLIYSIPSEESFSIAFSPNGQYLAAAIGDENAIRIWNAANWAPVKTLTVDGVFLGPRIAFSPDSQVIGAGWNTGQDAGALRFWALRTGRVLDSENRSGAIISLAFSPDGKMLSFTQFDGLVVMAAAPRTPSIRGSRQ